MSKKSNTPPTTARPQDVAEQKRLNDSRELGIRWKKWGPYLSERQWGTVREDYSADGGAWTTSATTSLARELTAGAKTALAASPTISSASASLSPSGTSVTQF